MATAKELAVFYTKLAENDNGFKYNSTHVDTMGGPNLYTVPDCMKYFEINPPKPKVKKIDLSVCIKSGIDMEFADEDTDADKWWVVGKLSAIKVYEKLYYVDEQGANFRFCRVRQNHWHSWQGGSCPLPEGLNVDYRLRGSIYISPKTEKSWQHDGTATDIIAFKVIGTLEDWEY